MPPLRRQGVLPLRRRSYQCVPKRMAGGGSVAVHKREPGEGTGASLPDSSINWLPSYTVTGGGTWPDPQSYGACVDRATRLPQQIPRKATTTADAVAAATHAVTTKHQHITRGVIRRGEATKAQFTFTLSTTGPKSERREVTHEGISPRCNDTNHQAATPTYAPHQISVA